MEMFNNIVRLNFINILIYLVVVKLINDKNNSIEKMVIIAIASIFEVLMTMTLIKYINVLPTMLLQFSLHGFIISGTTKNRFQYSIVAMVIALALTYIAYIISMILSSVILKIFIPVIQKDNILILFVGIIIESILICYLFKIKRLKNGLSFLQNKQKVDHVGFVGLILCGATILIYSLFGDDKSFKVNESLIIGIVILAICMIIWISKKLTAFYKKKLKEQTIELLEGEIKKKDNEISRILEENKSIATINHKYSSRIKSLEKISAKIASNPAVMEMMKTEFGEEFGDFEKQIKKLSEEYSKEMNEKVKHKNNLPKTGIFGIDNLLEYMRSEAEKDNIKFELKVNGNVNYMVENVIDQSKLETLLGDHIKDAIIAIQHSNNTYKSILAIIGIIDEYYEVCIYDTGIEFEVDTLENLGTKAITTHKETGGSGIGFMTTFETLKATKASLIIEEKHPVSNTDYTKAVRIRFDEKGEYTIRSYRAEEIREHKNSNRITIKNI